VPERVNSSRVYNDYPDSAVYGLDNSFAYSREAYWIAKNLGLLAVSPAVVREAARSLNPPASTYDPPSRELRLLLSAVELTL